MLISNTRLICDLYDICYQKMTPSFYFMVVHESSMPPISSPPPALAHVEVFDVRQNERAVVLACDWVGNIYKFVELVFHAKSDFLDAGGFYLHAFLLCQTVESSLVEAGRSVYNSMERVSENSFILQSYTTCTLLTHFVMFWIEVVSSTCAMISCSDTILVYSLPRLCISKNALKGCLR